MTASMTLPANYHAKVKNQVVVWATGNVLQVPHRRPGRARSTDFWTCTTVKNEIKAIGGFAKDSQSIETVDEEDIDDTSNNAGADHTEWDWPVLDRQRQTEFRPSISTLPLSVRQPHSLVRTSQITYERRTNGCTHPKK